MDFWTCICFKFIILLTLNPWVSICSEELKNIKIGPEVRSLYGIGTGGININPYDPIARVAGGFWSKIFKHLLPPSQELSTSTARTTPNYTPPRPLTSTLTPLTSSPAPILFTTNKVSLAWDRVSSTSRTTTSSTTKPTSEPETMSTSTTIMPTSTTTVPTTHTVPPGWQNATASSSTKSSILSTSTSSSTTDSSNSLSTHSMGPNINESVSITPIPLLSSTPSTDQLLNCIDWLMEWLQSNMSVPLRSKGQTYAIN